MSKSPPDLCDWELLQNSDDTAVDHGADELKQHLDSNCDDAVFQSDYFSLESHPKEASSDDASAVSDNPSWIDPASDAPFPPLNSAEALWSDSDSASESQVCSAVTEFDDDDDAIDGDENLMIVEESTSPPSPSPSPKPRVLWWKTPLDLFKYCVFRVSPVWSLSAAAALLGFFILGRRLYKMKRKTHALHLKLIIDDNKRVYQFRSHASRLNEAFSLVRRVPMIRPSLPGPGAAAWPVMSMR